MKTLSALALLLALAGPASASAAEECADASTQLAVNACAGAELARADAELDSVHREVSGKLTGDTALSRLKAAQRLWIQLRDADLAVRYPAATKANPRAREGSMYPALYAQARTRMTRARIDYLRGEFLEHGGIKAP
ncbi:MAG TPA: lysozyme inhibitor LprI family protein [Pseudoxanthomonas sp.]|nr:lysozyme inhibitor LprI family protein [Pseudoxanthomonas sp.]